MTDNSTSFWNSRLFVAIVAGFFALGGVLFSWYLEGPGKEPPPGSKSAADELAIKRAEESERRDKLVKKCTQSARGLFEAALLADGLLKVVESGKQVTFDNPEADAFCRKSEFIDPLNLDTGHAREFYWIESTQSEGAKVVCTCST